jgi:putative phage-type endonuclease
MTQKTDIIDDSLPPSESCAAVYGGCLAAQVCPPQTPLATMHAPHMLGTSRHNGTTAPKAARGEFLAERLTGLGGSDIGAILGLSPYKTAVDVWAEKTGRSEPVLETLQMRFGTFAEEFVAREYSAITGRSVQRFTPMLRHPTAPLIGHVDRLVIPDGQKRASHHREIRTDTLLEAKTASAFAAYREEEWGAAGSDAVPMAYLVQVATYRILTGCPHADLAVLFGNQEVRVYHLHHDPELEEMIVARAAEWWQRHVVADLAPAPSTEGDLKLLYPQSTPRAAEANDEIISKVKALHRVRTGIAALEAQADDTTIAIKSAMGDAELLTWQGRTIATWKSAKPGRKTDWKSVAAAVAADQAQIDKFTNETAGSRRFLLKDESK